MEKVGVIFGRFQGFHLGHLEYLLAGKKKCEHLIIGITNYEPYLNQDMKILADLNRTKLSSNPFTYLERYQMIKGSMIEAGVDSSSFDIVPFPIENPKNIFNFAPVGAVFFITLFDEWGYEKERRLKDLGCKTEVIYKEESSRITSGTEVRNRIKSNLEWKNLVPKFVYDYINQNELEEKLKQS